jgi:hypothetical protein
MTEEIHHPYRHLQDHPDVGNWDGIQSIDFCGGGGGSSDGGGGGGLDECESYSSFSASPDLSVVVLTVGHPPFLWTDVLVCAKLEECIEKKEEERGDDGGGHKNGETAVSRKKQKKWWIVHKSSDNQPHPLSAIHSSSN